MYSRRQDTLGRLFYSRIKATISRKESRRGRTDVGIEVAMPNLSVVKCTQNNSIATIRYIYILQNIYQWRPKRDREVVNKRPTPPMNLWCLNKFLIIDNFSTLIPITVNIVAPFALKVESGPNREVQPC